MTWTLKSATAVVALTLLLVGGSPALAADGQGPADPNSVLSEASLGEYWFGEQVSLDQLKGKVVLFEIYGS